MSTRFRNNLFAFVIVFAFWCVSFSAIAADPIVTNSTSNSTVTSSSSAKSTIKTNPPSAISPSINASNSDLCTVGVSGAVQTSIIGISTGQTYISAPCSRRKDAKILFDMGMKVASVALMCQSRDTWDAMKFSGTPCPIFDSVTGEGLIGAEATAEWKKNPKKIPKKINNSNFDRGAFLEKLTNGILSVILLAILLI